VQEVNADQDIEILERAKALIDLVKTHAADLIVAKGIDLDDVEAEYIKVTKILAEGTATAVRMKNVKIKTFEGDDITARSGGADPNARRQ